MKGLRALHRLCLTGTPIENRPAELWSLFDFLMPGHLGAHGAFVRTFEEPILAGDATAAERLRRRVGPFLLRRLKQDVAKDLPEKIELRAWCELTAEQAALYRQVLDGSLPTTEALARGERVNFATSILPILTRLQQVCDHPAIVEPDGATPVTDGRSEKFDLALQEIEEVAELGEKVLVFSHFLRMLDLLGLALDRRGIGHVRLDGSTEDRQDVVDQFGQDDGLTVALCSLQATGYGVNLQAANHVVHVDRWWNPALEDQATARDPPHRATEDRSSSTGCWSAARSRSGSTGCWSASVGWPTMWSAARPGPTPRGRPRSCWRSCGRSRPTWRAGRRIGAASVDEGRRAMDVTFFATAEELRHWFEAHHDTATELWIGFHKKGAGKPGVTYPEAVDEALCFGWIDGVRRSLDETSYSNRFTPRRRSSNWSGVNLKRVEELTALGRMRPAGIRAHAARDRRAAEYSYESADRGLGQEYEERFRSHPAAWEYFQAQPPSYRRTASWWVMSAKREETRQRRLATLIEDSANGQRIALLRRTAR